MLSTNKETKVSVAINLGSMMHDVKCELFFGDQLCLFQGKTCTKSDENGNAQLHVARVIFGAKSC